MKLNEISLRNIRSHVNSKVEFKEGITTLTGPTGSGKTSFLLAIEFCLFGSRSIPNSAMLRRGKKKGRIELSFLHQGHDYRIVRGLEKQGDSVLTDNSSLEIYKDGKKLSFFRRVSGFDQKILKILGYPASVDPEKLFEVTTYTKQNEIRKLTESRGEKRQEYIDRVLQLSKYRETWEGLRSIINKFQSQRERLRGRIESIKEKKQHIERLEEELEEDREKLNKSKTELKKLEENLDRLGKRIEELEERKKELKESKKKYDKFKTILNQKKENFKELKSELEALKLRVDKIEEELEEREIRSLEELRTNKGELKQREKALKQENEDIEFKLQEVLEGKVGANCPLCGQPLGEGGVEELKDHFRSEVKKNEKELEKIKSKVNKINKDIKEAKEIQELNEEKKKRLDRLKDVEDKAKSLQKEIKKYKEKKEDLKKEKEQFENLKQKLEALEQDRNKKNTKKSGLEEKIKLLKKSIERSRQKIKKRKEELGDLRSEKEEYKKLEKTCLTLSNLRENIRGIRKVVRRKFLQEFEREFQRLFQKIRREDEYIVNIEEDYEPKAYTSEGREVEIRNLSGGEKTSVGLAYRLALSKIAASIGGITPPEFLMLDEPTSGFDRSDIKNLVEILRKLNSIPQIIVVSHEEEIKNAADFKYEVRKENGISKTEEV